MCLNHFTLEYIDMKLLKSAFLLRTRKICYYKKIIESHFLIDLSKVPWALNIVA